MLCCEKTVFRASGSDRDRFQRLNLVRVLQNAIILMHCASFIGDDSSTIHFAVLWV